MVVEIDHADIGGGEELEFALPPGAVVVGGFIGVTKTFNAGTSDTMSLKSGDGSVTYVNAASVKSAGKVDVVPTGYIHPTANASVKLSRAIDGTAPTQGHATLVLLYVRTTRATSTQD